MKLTKTQLREIIKEELSTINEVTAGWPVKIGTHRSMDYYEIGDQLERKGIFPSDEEIEYWVGEINEFLPKGVKDMEATKLKWACLQVYKKGGTLEKYLGIEIDQTNLR
jgi:hypothetical protein